jgi:hypothetical protein
MRLSSHRGLGLKADGQQETGKDSNRGSQYHDARSWSFATALSRFDSDMTHTITASRLAVTLLSMLVLAGTGLRGEWFTASAAPQREPAPPVQRQTTFGPVVGSDLSAASGDYAWKGVPFAKPPVGERRWKAPADPDVWTSPRLTQQFGNACSQAGRLYGPGQHNSYDATIGTSLGQTVGAEDCLYLNIWRPATADAQLPVIVWVHGGSNISGYTADPFTTARTWRASPTPSSSP